MTWLIDPVKFRKVLRYVLLVPLLVWEILFLWADGGAREGLDWVIGHMIFIAFLIGSYLLLAYLVVGTLHEIVIRILVRCGIVQGEISGKGFWGKWLLLFLLFFFLPWFLLVMKF